MKEIKMTISEVLIGLPQGDYYYPLQSRRGIVRIERGCFGTEVSLYSIEGTIEKVPMSFWAEIHVESLPVLQPEVEKICPWLRGLRRQPQIQLKMN